MTLFQKLADWASVYCGTPRFLGIHIIWWSIWIAFGLEPFPYGLLTMLLSLEAIILAILILNSSNRQGEEDRQVINRDLKLDHRTHKLVEAIWTKLSPEEDIPND